MSKRILLLVLILAGTSPAQWLNSGARFYWYRNGGTPTTDTLRFVQGTGATLTQSGKTLTIAATGTGATIANVRDSSGWTSNGVRTRIQTVSEVQVGGTNNKRQVWYDSDGDTVRIRPQPAANANVLEYKDGATALASIDSAGNGTFAGTITKMDLLDLAAGMWLNSPTTGTVDSTVAGIPMKMFSTSDTAFCDIFLPAHFSSLDSMVVLGGTISTLGDSAAFSVQVKTVARRGAYVGAFNTATIDSSDLGTANTQAFWKFTSFGSVTAFKTLRIKMWRSACSDNTGSDVYMERVILYGKGLR